MRKQARKLRWMMKVGELWKSGLGSLIAVDLVTGLLTVGSTYVSSNATLRSWTRRIVPDLQMLSRTVLAVRLL
jgi:hypothetical protein